MNAAEPLSGGRKAGLALEGAALFLGVPAATAAGWIPLPVIPLLLLMAAGCGLTLRWRHQIHLRDLLRPEAARPEWRRILILYAVAVPFLVGLLWLIQPSAMFILLRRHPYVWLLVMFAYPVLSVLTQELIYRAFFFERYRPLFGRGTAMVVASAAVFGFGHVVFHNWISVVLTFAGGLLFATTYQRSSSLLLVAAEHALYGCAIFTIGFGQFFFAGTLRLIQ